MMVRSLAGGLMLMTMGCATVADEREPDRMEGIQTCNVEAVQNLVGQQATAELGRDALQRSGSGALRWIRPGDAVTMDYRTDRLNIELDARGRVARIYCG
ncbi:MAG: I78 family peptidase inhibitor [Allosphingosinicella sp.]|uniref:I78 family peptidase inhibitor n=1 Tax=Allosphingosinicella sp. TaxID=2823234 RepID=UPI00393956B8